MTAIYPETISETLDRLEVTASKIGMNTAGASLALLRELDAVSARVQELAPENASRKTASAQLESITARLRKEARQFLRDLGGAQSLRQARAEANPPEAHTWWFLDQWLETQRRNALRRVFIGAGIAVVVLVILIALYDRFLAPDPQVAARYGYQQRATSLLLEGDYPGALAAIEQGLQVAPQDPELLVMKGVVQDQMGETSQALENFQAAQKSFQELEHLYLTRGETYLMANLTDKALADAETAIQINPQSARAYLLRAQVHEARQTYQQALEDYETAYRLADANDEVELAAVARIQKGMLSQKLSMPGITDTATPEQ